MQRQSCTGHNSGFASWNPTRRLGHRNGRWTRFTWTGLKVRVAEHGERISITSGHHVDVRRKGLGSVASRLSRATRNPENHSLIADQKTSVGSFA